MRAVDKIAAFLNGMDPEQIEELSQRKKKFNKKDFGPLEDLV